MSTPPPGRIRTADLRVLSIQQPWADLLARGIKTVENRTWPTRHRGWVVIHTGIRWDPAGARWAAANGHLVTRADLPRGAYIGITNLTGIHVDLGCCRPAGFPDVLHWTCQQSRRFAEPIPAHGFLGVHPLPVEHQVAVGHALIDVGFEVSAA